MKELSNGKSYTIRYGKGVMRNNIQQQPEQCSDSLDQSVHQYLSTPKQHFTTPYP